MLNGCEYHKTVVVEADKNCGAAQLITCNATTDSSGIIEFTVTDYINQQIMLLFYPSLGTIAQVGNTVIRYTGVQWCIHF
jgi:hypothetical protein